MQSPRHPPACSSCANTGTDGDGRAPGGSGTKLDLSWCRVSQHRPNQRKDIDMIASQGPILAQSMTISQVALKSQTRAIVKAQNEEQKIDAQVSKTIPK